MQRLTHGEEENCIIYIWWVLSLVGVLFSVAEVGVQQIHVFVRSPRHASRAGPHFAYAGTTPRPQMNPNPSGAVIVGVEFWGKRAHEGEPSRWFLLPAVSGNHCANRELQIVLSWWCVSSGQRC